MAWDVIIRTFLTDSGLSAGLAKANAGLAQLGRSGPGARAGLRAAETGMRALAFEAAGMGGPMGRVAAGLLQLGGGQALVIGAVAGIGAIALAYRLASAEADSLKTSNEKLAQSWRNVAGRGKPLVALANELQDAITAQTAAQDKLNKLRNFWNPLQLPTPGEIALAETGLSQAQANVTQMRTLFREAQVQLEADAQKAGIKTAQAFMEGIKFLSPQVQLQILALGERQFGARFEKLGGEAGALYATAWLRAAQAMLDRGLDVQGRPLGTGLGRGLVGGGSGLPKLEGGLGPAFKPEKFAPREFFIQDLEKAITKAQSPKLDAARLAAEAVALLGALKQGGAAGILGAGGGIVSELSGLKGLGGLGPIGIGLSVASGFFGLFERKSDERERAEERRHEELKAVLHEGFLRVTFFNADGTAESGLYEMRRAERLGGEPRLGGL